MSAKSVTSHIYYVLILIAITVGSGCATNSSSYRMQKAVSELNAAVRGKHISLINMVMGEYTRVIPDGSGGKIYIWVKPPRSLPPPSSNRDEYDDRWVVDPYLDGYEIKRVRPKKSLATSILEGINEGLEARARHRASRPFKIQMYVRSDGIVYWCRAGRD